MSKGVYFVLFLLVGVLVLITALFLFKPSSPKKIDYKVIQKEGVSTSETFENPFIEVPSPTLANPFDEESGNPFGEGTTESEDQPYQNPFSQ